jgi:hypothetical protein
MVTQANYLQASPALFRANCQLPNRSQPLASIEAELYFASYPEVAAVFLKHQQH